MVCSSSFSKQTGLSAMETFYSNVDAIIIELSSYCNRSCLYCPVASDKSKKNNQNIPDKIFFRVLKDAIKMRYEKKFCLNLFNEPLYDIDYFIERVKTIRRFFPKNHIHAYSNGDFVKKGDLERLYFSGLSHLEITLHLANPSDYNDDFAMKSLSSFQKKIGLPLFLTEVSSGKAIIAQGIVRNCCFQVHVKNYLEVGIGRVCIVDALKDKKYRTGKCIKPTNQFVVDHKGDVQLCCNLYTNHEKHKPWIIGNVLNDHIYDIYCSDMMSTIRNKINKNDTKDIICGECFDY